jgi:hypothetical protein
VQPLFQGLLLIFIIVRLFIVIDRFRKANGDYRCPAGISDIEHDLHATSGEISLSLALFILVQGGFPIFWSVISELKGRKVT